MIRKLRNKFIAVALFSMLAVLLTIGAIAALLSYGQIVSEADRILDLLAENDGTFPKPEFPKKDFGVREFSAETPYETRFFSVVLNESGERIRVDTGRIAAVSSTDAVAYAENVYKTYPARTGGFVGNFRYGIYEKGENRLLIFVDCGRTLSAFLRFVRNILLISVIGLLAVWILLSVISGRVVAPIAESYEKQRRFITDAGHELKTPLAIIRADADVLEMEGEGENEWIDDIRLQTERLSHLTENLILLARMEESADPQSFTCVDLSALCEKVTESFAAPAKVRGLTLSSETEGDCIVYGEERSIFRLLSVLLDNAMKYTVENGTVTLRLCRAGRQIRICVDNSIETPLDKEQLRHMFDRFYRTDDSRNSETGGHGIGLSIAQAIVTRHKGSVTAVCPNPTTLSIRIVLPAASGTDERRI